MGKCVKEGVGIVRQGHVEDYVEFPDELIGLSQLVEQAASIESPEDGVQAAMGYEGIGGGADEFWRPLRDAYRRESGRQYPPVYRIRIMVEAEALGDAETAAWWHKKQAGG